MNFLKKISVLLITLIILISCTGQKNNSPEALAQKFCNCSEEISKAVVKLKNQKITQKEFEKIKNEQITCMGPADPRQHLNQAELEKFDMAFHKALFEKCPNVARNYGFKE